MSTSLRQLEAFVTVARLGSFTRAAAQLQVSQPGLSLMVRDLEAHFKGPLFDRSKRAVRLTSAGELLLPMAQNIVGEFARATLQLRASNAESASRLSVASTPLFSSALMPAVYQRFRQRHPGTDLQVTVLSRDEVGEAVRRGDSDCGVGIFSDGTAHLKVEPLFKFGFILLRPAQAKAAALRAGPRSRPTLAPIAWRALPDAPYVELPASSRLQQVINKRKTDAGLPIRPPAQTLDHLETIIGMTAAGAGPSVLPSFALAGCAGFQLEIQRISDAHPPLDFHLVTARGREEASALRGFFETLRVVLGQQVLI